VEAIQRQMKVDILLSFRNVSDRWYLISPWTLGCRLPSSTSASLSGKECALVNCISWGSEFLVR